MACFALPAGGRYRTRPVVLLTLVLASTGLPAPTWVAAQTSGSAATERPGSGGQEAESRTSGLGPHRIRIDHDVPVRMRDGVTLSADVYRPDAPGRFPVIVERTPYDNSRVERTQTGRYLASHGYVYVTQDVRGRGDSDGDFYPLIHEALDGYDTQSWAGRQSWSDGRVGTTGGSYMGWTQVYPAGLNNPHLGAMVSIVTPPDPVRNFPLRFGTVSPTTISWLVTVSGRSLQDISHLDLEAAYWTLPLQETDRALGWHLQPWRDWLDHPTLDDYWQKQAYQEKLLEATAPILHVSGWYDDVLIGTLENYVNMTRGARHPQARRNQRLLIGPWGHSVNRDRRWGPIDFGPDALIDLNAIQRRWFDRWLKGENNGVDSESPVRIFVMGANEWRSEEEWPLARTEYVEYYLHSRGHANTRLGDGTLSTLPPAAEPADQYRYDPADPTPFSTGFGYSQVGGPDDYREVELRDDVLVYTGPTLTEEMEVCGPLSVTLYASSSARDTDWTARILNVHPDGYAQRLNDGITRARFRNGLEREDLLTPGGVEEYAIDAWATCVRLGPGHRLRLEISSSSWPQFDRNLNTGGPLWKESGWIVADQTVYHDRTRPSHVLIPVIPPGNAKVSGVLDRARGRRR